MSLGNNRDYKTWARIVTGRLAKHHARMTELIAQGMDKDAASKQALQEMKRKPKKGGAA